MRGRPPRRIVDGRAPACPSRRRRRQLPARGETMVTSALTTICRQPAGAARETAPVPHRVSCPAFVGRTEELSVLEATLARVATGRAATVLVGGDAGIGKTRLVDEWGGQARAAGALVATGV